jgi:hypothetical protein
MNVWSNGFETKKKQMKSGNHEIFHDVMVSYKEAVIKNWECFAHFHTYNVYKPKILEKE